MTFLERYGPAALITGAAHGTGRAFASALAARGLDLVLLDMDGSGLEAVTEALRQRHPERRVTPLALDLARQDQLERVEAAVEGVELGLLVCNAAQSHIGSFFDTPLERHRALLEINARSTLELVHAIGGRLRAQRRGGVILMSSLSALRGAVFVTSYAATKAYALSLAEGLAYELRPHNVDVLGVIAGPINTPGFNAVEHTLSPLLRRFMMEPEAVIEACLGALGRRDTLIPGRLNQLQAFVTHRLLSRRASTELIVRNLRELYATFRY